MTTRIARRNIKALPQIESTVSLSITSKLMKFTARQDFVVGNCQVKAGETCFAVRSERRPGRYYIVRFNTDRNTYQCSCGANCCKHEHITAIQQYVLDHVVQPKIEKTAPEIKIEIPTMEQSNDSRPLTAAEWKEIHKRDKARQRAWQQEYRDAAKALEQEIA